MPYANNNGTPLQYIGDAVTLVLNNSAPPTGPDAAARFSISGTYSGATLIFEKVSSLAQYTAGSWTPLPSVIRKDTNNALANSTVQPTASASLDFGVAGITAYYAIRMRLSAITTGTITAEGVSVPSSLADTGVLLSSINLNMQRLVLGISELCGTDLTGLTAADSL